MIDVKDLSVKYGGVTSLDGMNLRFEEGVCGLIGPNGAGKTTFFNVLSGFVRPASGGVTAFGDDLLRMTHFRRARWGIRRTFQTEQAISAGSPGGQPVLPAYAGPTDPRCGWAKRARPVPAEPRAARPRPAG